MATDINNTPQSSVELKGIPEEVKSALTQDEMNEVISAQKKAVLRANTAERIDVLNQEISDGTKKKLTDNGLLLSEIIQEKWILDKAWDSISKLWKQAWENVTNPINAIQSTATDLSNVPGINKLAPVAAVSAGVSMYQTGSDVKSVWERRIDTFREIYESKDDFFTKVDKFFGHIGSILSEFGNAFMAMFKGDFDQISEFFGFGGFPDKVRKSMDWIDKNIDISDAFKTGFSDLFIKVKGFKDLTISQLREAMNETDIAKKLGIEANNDVLKGFFENIFEKENFAKISAQVTENLSLNGTIDEKTMKIGDFITALAPKKS